MPYKIGPIICGMLILALAFAAQAAAFEQRVPARVKKVIDGDTVKVEARLWPGIIAQINVRVRGGDRQVKGAKRALGHTLGGPGAVSSVFVMSKN